MPLAVGDVVYASSRLRGGESDIDGVPYHIHCNRDMAARAGTLVTITAVLQKNAGVTMYRIAEDNGDYMWSDVMLTPTKTPLPTVVNDNPRITPEYAEYLYRSTGVMPLQQGYFRKNGEQQYADIMGVQMLSFGFTPENDPDTFFRLFYSEEYSSGVIAGWDSPIEDPGLRARHNMGTREEYRQGYSDACEAIFHLKKVGFLSEVRTCDTH